MLAADLAVLVAVAGINRHCDPLQCGPGRRGWGAWAIDRGLAQPFTARLFGKRRSNRLRSACGFHTFRTKSGNLAIFAAIRRASALVSSLAANLRPGSSSNLSTVIPHNETGGPFINGPRRREAAGHPCCRFTTEKEGLEQPPRSRLRARLRK